MKSLQLGATLYIPAINNDLVSIANHQKYPNLRSLVLCTEDSTAEIDLPLALDNLRRTLPQLEQASLFRFIRPRNPQVLQEIVDMQGINAISGVVLPKVTIRSLEEYGKILEKHEQLQILLILETQDMFNQEYLYTLRDVLLASPLRERIMALRIGALDFLGLLGLRRNLETTIYQSPIAFAISQIISVFKPAGFAITAPAYEGFSQPDVLREELDADIAFGLYGKTALHPDQIDIIHAAYAVGAQDLEMAKAILDSATAAVFRMNDRMCEKAVHTGWAKVVVERAQRYGVKAPLSPSAQSL